MGARLGSGVLSSPASTSLRLLPSSPGRFTVTVRARDGNGRLVRSGTVTVDAIDPHPADSYSETFAGTTEVRENVTEVLVSTGTIPLYTLPEVEVNLNYSYKPPGGTYDGGSAGGFMTQWYTRSVYPPHEYVYTRMEAYYNGVRFVLTRRNTNALDFEAWSEFIIPQN